MKMNLGIIHKENRIIGHRSLLKVLVNPFLRVFGFQIATNIKNGTLGSPCITRCTKRHFQTAWSYPSEGCSIERRRIII